MKLEFDANVRLGALLVDHEDQFVAADLEIWGSSPSGFKRFETICEARPLVGSPKIVDASIARELDIDIEKFAGYEAISFGWPHSTLEVSTEAFALLSIRRLVFADCHCTVSQVSERYFFKLLINPHSWTTGASTDSNKCNFFRTASDLFTDETETTIPVTFSSDITLDHQKVGSKFWGYPGYQYLCVTRDKGSFRDFSDRLFTRESEREGENFLTTFKLTKTAMRRYFYLRTVLVARVVNELLFPYSSIGVMKVDLKKTELMPGAESPWVTIPAANEESTSRFTEPTRLDVVIEDAEQLVLRCSLSSSALANFLSDGSYESDNKSFIDRGILADWYISGFGRYFDISDEPHFGSGLSRRRALLSSPTWALMVCRAWLETIDFSAQQYKTALRYISEFLADTWDPSAEKAKLAFTFFSNLSRDMDPQVHKICEHHLNRRIWFKLPPHLTPLKTTGRRYATELGYTEFLQRFGYAELYQGLLDDIDNDEYF